MFRHPVRRIDRENELLRGSSAKNVEAVPSETLDGDREVASIRDCWRAGSIFRLRSGDTKDLFAGVDIEADVTAHAATVAGTIFPE